jgi:fused signal recognition particle receptor
MGLLRTTLGAIRLGLARTRARLGESLRALLAGPRLDEQTVDRVESLLISADLGVAATSAIVGALREAYRGGRVEAGADALRTLRTQLKQRLGHVDRSLRFAATGPTVILVAGVNGSGKTTSIAKIARSLVEQGRSVLLAAADTYRAGAIAQLEIWARRLGVGIVKGAPGADPAAVAFDAAEAATARGVDVLLVDTAGRLHTQDSLMRQLTKIRTVVAKKIEGGPHEVLLVLDATAGQNAIAQAEVFKKAIDVTGIVLAKLDGTAKGGIVVAIQDALGIPVKLVGVGERPEDLEPFDPDAFVDALLE